MSPAPSSPAKREVSAGIVVYRKAREGPKFLILYHGHNYWNFPKGHIENEEKSLAAALRETREEAGFQVRDLKLAGNFKAYERFYFRRSGQTIFKIVIFYLAETRKTAVRVSDEHQGYGWFLYKDAQGILGKYRDSQKVLRSANEFLSGVRQRDPQRRRPHPNHDIRRSTPHSSGNQKEHPRP